MQCLEGSNSSRNELLWIRIVQRVIIKNIPRHSSPRQSPPMKMLQSLNALAGKISPGSPTDGNANKVHMHNNNNNNNNNVSHHPHPYLKQQSQQSSRTVPINGEQKENRWVFVQDLYRIIFSSFLARNWSTDNRKKNGKFFRLSIY